MAKKKRKNLFRNPANLVAIAILVLILVIVLIAIGYRQTTSSSASGYSIKINQASPRYGDSVNFTSIYPKDGDKKIGRQQMFQPQVQVLCSQGSTRVFAQITSMAIKTQNGDGTVTGVTGDVKLGGYSKNGLYWASGGADCTVNIVYYATKDLNLVFVASSNFTVAD